MAIDVICLEDPAFYKLIDVVVKHIETKLKEEKEKWITPDEARGKLGIGKTKFFELKARKEIDCTQDMKNGKFLVRDKSIEDYLKRKNS